MDTISPTPKVARAHFAPILKEAWQKAAACFNTHFGFEILGIYPINLNFPVSEAVWLHQLLTLALQKCLISEAIALPQELKQTDVKPRQGLNQRKTLLNGLYFKILSLCLFWINCQSAEKDSCPNADRPGTG